MTIKSKFETPDGKLFNDLKDAEKYWKTKTKVEMTAMDKWWKTSYWAKNLQKDGYTLESRGHWEIRGEDSNPEFGGVHHMPLLAIVKGTLKQAMDYAGTNTSFFTWGSGGDIRPIKIIDLSDTK